MQNPSSVGLESRIYVIRSIIIRKAEPISIKNRYFLFLVEIPVSKTESAIVAQMQLSASIQLSWCSLKKSIIPFMFYFFPV